MYAPSSFPYVLLSKINYDGTKLSFLSLNDVFLLSYTIAHTGYDSCLKCTDHTVYDRDTHRLHFSGVDAPKRTAPLIALSYLVIIDDVHTTDRLHLIDLGVKRFFIRSWKKKHFLT